jgi:hypothetical protein
VIGSVVTPGETGRVRSVVRTGRVVVPFVMAVALLVGGCGKSGNSAGPNSAPAATASAAGMSTGGPNSASATGSGAAVTCPSSNTVRFAKTKFLAHTGEAFGVFHRYLYKPYRAGTFSSSSTKSKVVAFAKAGVAALFIKRQVRLASEDVRANPTLCKAIAAPLASVGDSITSAVDKLKSGDASGLTAANSAISAIEGSAGKAGDPVTEDPNAKVS